MRISQRPVFCACVAAALAMVGFGTARPAQAVILSGFNNFSLNTFGTPLGGSINTPTDTQLTLTTATTNGTGQQGTSSFYTSQLATGAFTASFVYTMTPGTGYYQEPANGFTFTIQNDPRGSAGVGTSGAGIGYGDVYGLDAQLVNSVAVEFDIYTDAPSSTSPGMALGVNGSLGPPYPSVSPVNLLSTDPILVQLSYSGGTALSVTLTDQNVPADTFSTTLTLPGTIASIVGNGGNAYVGFTGGSGAGTSTQLITSFSFDDSAATVPLPPALAGGLVLLAAFGLVQATRRTA